MLLVNFQTSDPGLVIIGCVGPDPVCHGLETPWFLYKMEAHNMLCTYYMSKKELPILYNNFDITSCTYSTT